MKDFNHLTLSDLGYFYQQEDLGGGGGYHTVNHIYILSLNLNFQVSSFNSLDLAAIQSSAAKSIRTSNFPKIENL